MKGWIGKTWMGCVFAFSVGAPLAHADGGTMMFSGAVVAPTCAASTGDITAAASPRHAGVAGRVRFGCGEGQGQAAASAPSSYVLTVEPLESSSLSTDRLVAYFSSYMKAAGNADANMNLVTQAYE